MNDFAVLSYWLSRNDSCCKIQMLPKCVGTGWQMYSKHPEIISFCMLSFLEPAIQYSCTF